MHDLQRYMFWQKIAFHFYSAFHFDAAQRVPLLLLLNRNIQTVLLHLPPFHVLLRETDFPARMGHVKIKEEP